MRLMTIVAVAALSLAGGISGAVACAPIRVGCLPPTVVWPVYTEGGRYLGAVEAPVQRPPTLDVSRFTGQPITVLYNNPGSLPGSVDPYLHLEALPHVKHSSTLGAYPVGY